AESPDRFALIETELNQFGDGLVGEFERQIVLGLKTLGELLYIAGEDGVLLRDVACQKLAQGLFRIEDGFTSDREVLNGGRRQLEFESAQRAFEDGHQRAGAGF